MDGADLLYFISVSPSRGLSMDENFESAEWVEHVGQAYASLFTCFVAQTNRVGYEDGINFWGGASAYDPNGEQLAKGPYHEESLTIAELDLDELTRTRKRLPLLRDERAAMVQRELNRITQERGRAF
jgi:predicted amidohydrolase